MALHVTKQVQKNSFFSYVLSNQLWWCILKQFLSYSKNYISRFMQTKLWQHKLFHFCLSFWICPHKKPKPEKPIFNRYSKHWKKQDLTEKNWEKERKTWYMLLMRFNWVLVRFNQILRRFNPENFLVWQNYWQIKKSCDKLR